jgi:hypothetical protein
MPREFGKKYEYARGRRWRAGSVFGLEALLRLASADGDFSSLGG